MKVNAIYYICVLMPGNKINAIFPVELIKVLQSDKTKSSKQTFINLSKCFFIDGLIMK